MAKILLTGGSGFIGRNILESELASRHKISAPLRRDLDLRNEDAVADELRRGRYDVVIHSAVKPAHRNASDAEGIFYENTRMFFNLARNSSCFGRMLVIGSGAIYDMRHYTPKMRESCFDVHVPVDELGLSKYVCGKYMDNSTNITDLRVFGIFGKYEDYSIRFISNMICKALADLPLTIKQDRRFDYIYVTDLVEVLGYFIDNAPKYRAYNVTPDSAVELSRLAQLVRKISGKDLPIRISADGMASEYSGDNSLLKSEMGEAYKNKPLEESVSELYAWYSSNFSVIDIHKLLVDK